MTNDARYLEVGKRLAGLRQAYVVVATGQRSSWLLFSDRLERLIDAMIEATKVGEVNINIDAFNTVCQHAVDGLRNYERRRTVAPAELRDEMERLTRTLIAFWQF
jgi:hypothetical protein